MFEKLSEVYDYTWNRGISVTLNEWKDAWERPGIRIQLGCLAALTVFYSWVVPGFFRYIQQRQGAVLDDPVLHWLPAMDLSLYCFSILYLSLIFTFFYLLRQPDKLIIALTGYFLLLALRLLAIYLVPLNPPPRLVPLDDPFIDHLFYVNMHITKDLFFSGHVSTLFILYLSVDHQRLRRLILTGCCFVAVMLLIQHVHYTLDVLAAPFFSWVAYRLAAAIHNRLHVSPEASVSNTHRD